MQDEETKPKSHSPTPILDGDEAMEDDRGELGTGSERDEEEMSEAKIDMDGGDEGYDEDDQGEYIKYVYTFKHEIWCAAIGEHVEYHRF